MVQRPRVVRHTHTCTHSNRGGSDKTKEVQTKGM